jgi:hypothetical protein
VQEVHFSSGSVFVTGDTIAMALLRYVEAVAMTRRSDMVVVPVAIAAGAAGTVTLMVNGVSQISAGSIASDDPELEDHELVDRLETSTRELLGPSTWTGADSPFAA